MVGRSTAVAFVLALGWLCTSCEPLTPCDELEVPIAQSEQGLVVTPAEHPDGWGREDCEACHALVVVHQRECTNGVDYLVLDDLIATGGYDSCQLCHGSNGVEP